MFWAMVSVFIFADTLLFCKCEKRTEINIIRVLCQVKGVDLSGGLLRARSWDVLKWITANFKGMATEITLKRTKWEEQKKKDYFKIKIKKKKTRVSTWLSSLSLFKCFVCLCVCCAMALILNGPFMLWGAGVGSFLTFTFTSLSPASPSVRGLHPKIFRVASFPLCPHVAKPAHAEERFRPLRAAK